MNFRWDGLLPLTEYLYENYVELPCEEGVFRTIINRSYYSALNTAALYIREIIGDDLPGDHRYHDQVLGYFSEEKKVHDLLDMLREKRRRADYNPESQQFREMAYTSIQELKEFLAKPQIKNALDPEN